MAEVEKDAAHRSISTGEFLAEGQLAPVVFNRNPLATASEPVYEAGWRHRRPDGNPGRSSLLQPTSSERVVRGSAHACFGVSKQETTVVLAA